MTLSSHALSNKEQIKNKVTDLAIFGGQPLFEKIRSTSNLVQPDEKNFFKYAKKIFENRRLTNNGPMVLEMERRLAEIHQAKYCVAVCNGLWGLVMCLHALAKEGKSEVIMPSLTYRRMADVAAWVKLTPNFCDVDAQTMGMKPELVEPLINKNTAIILAAHPIVNLSDIDGLIALAKKHNIPIMFDSVEAAYASHESKMLGQFGAAEVFSMHASKFLNGFEAGYITTNNSELAQKLRLIRGFGFYGPDNVIEFGLNAKLNELHAAMALAGLDDLSDQVDRNKVRYHAYRESLKNISGIELVQYDKKEIRSFKTILVKLNDKWPISREDTIKLMHKEHMFVRPYYSPALHAKKTQYKTISGDMTNTNILAEQFMLMPCGDFVDITDVERISSFMRFIQDNGAEIKEKLKAVK